MKTSLLSLIAGLFLAPVCRAQMVSGETEFGSDGKGGSFISQYVFFDDAHWNGLARYSWVNHTLNRGEFAYGPTWKAGEKTTFKADVGLTTEPKIITIFNVFSRFDGRNNFYVADAKHSTNSAPSTLYQKLFVGIDTADHWHLKIETLAVRHQFAFCRLGFEFRQPVGPKAHVAVNPFYDPRSKAVGIMGDFRFF